MNFGGPEDTPQLPLTPRRKAMLAAGAALFLAQIAAAIAIAPPTTGTGDANPGVLLIAWLASIAVSVVTVLLIIRQADLPDIATASMIVAIAVLAAFALTAAYDVRGTQAEANLTDALFLGVTAGGLTAMIVWGIATAVARALKLPTTAHLRDHP